jgi:uncharacterized protein (TIGR04255 family)
MEAVLDIRVRPHTAPNLTELESIHERILDRFPEKQGITNWEAGFQFTQDGGQHVTQTSARPIGFLFKSVDRTKVVQVSETGFTFNKLRPYERWSTFRDEARHLWLEYIETVGPVSVSRTALRYINRIELPLPFGDFKEFILTVPEVAPGISQALEQFFMRLEIPYPDISAFANVTLTMDRSAPIIDKLPLIFDIDVFRQTEFDPLSEEIWQSLEELRTLKNQIFFSSLTDKVKELFR